LLTQLDVVTQLLAVEGEALHVRRTTARRTAATKASR
jgi:hypothetical protein